jgi:CsoR family transcriptional regulator, copper-sensing transcriptional repressor
MNRPDKTDLAARLKRIAGQIGGIERMVDQDRYCVDIVMQVSAARAALSKVAKILLASHLETCVSDAFAMGGRDRREKIDELLRLFETDL